MYVQNPVFKKLRLPTLEHHFHKLLPNVVNRKKKNASLLPQKI